MPATMLVGSESSGVVFCDASFRAKGNPPSIGRALATADLAWFENPGWCASVVVLVDEPVPPVFEQRAKFRHRGALRLPSGRLGAVEQERLSDDARDSQGETTLAPGTYLLEVLELEWGAEGKRAAAEAARRASPLGRVMVKVLSALWLVVTLCGFALTLSGWVSHVWLVAVVLWWGLTALAMNVGPGSAALNAEHQTLDTFPAAVLHLTPLPDRDNLAAHRGVKFGSG
jgi:hypothetical protein